MSAACTFSLDCCTAPIVVFVPLYVVSEQIVVYGALTYCHNMHPVQTACFDGVPVVLSFQLMGSQVRAGQADGLDRLQVVQLQLRIHVLP